MTSIATAEKPKKMGVPAEPGTILIKRTDKYHCVARIAVDLIPEELHRKAIDFIPTPDAENRILRLKPVLRDENGHKPHGVLRGLYNNPKALSPRVSFQDALQWVGVKLKKKQMTIKATKMDDGTIEIRFP